MAEYFETPFGSAVYPHLTKPDSKYRPDAPEYKVDLLLTGKAALQLKAKIDEAAQAAFEAFKETDQYLKMKPKDQRELSVFYPYEEVEDDEGNLTGDIKFHFRQNAKIKLKDKSIKDIKIGIYDSKGKEMLKDVGGGSTIRVRYSLRSITIISTKRVGVRLDFASVQVKDLVARGAGSSSPFGAVDGGYEDDGDDYVSESPSASSSSPADDSADY